jgi:DNA recombination protein RmuC
MFIALVILQCVVLLTVIALYLRRTPANESDSSITDKLIRLDEFVRDALTQTRKEASEEASRTRKENAESSADLRKEVVGSITTLGNTLKDGLDSFRADNAASATALRNEVEQKMRSISQGFTDFKIETGSKHSALEESINRKLVELMESNAAHQEKLRSAVEERLTKLNESNAAKLEEMRVTVDEKLQSTLNERLTQSFGQVTTHLGEVQKGLGEMKELATGVGDLKKVLSNVSRRGGVGEFLVGQQLEQMFSPEQYLKQVRIKPNTREAVDYALKFPGAEPGSFVLLPIDAKFPTSDWERLEYAYDRGTAAEIAAAGKAFDRSIRDEAKSISDKYIDPPTTMPHAIMVLPTEGLYAELVRRPGLQSEIQSAYRITIAGPSTFMAILTSFQMGFHTLAIQKKGDEVWKVLSKTKNEFQLFEKLMGSMESQVGTVQNTIQKLGVRTRAINRTLREVSDSTSITPPELEEIAPISTLSLAASEDEE